MRPFGRWGGGDNNNQLLPGQVRSHINNIIKKLIVYLKVTFYLCYTFTFIYLHSHSYTFFYLQVTSFTFIFHLHLCSATLSYLHSHSFTLIYHHSRSFTLLSLAAWILLNKILLRDALVRWTLTGWW